jgi:hypothetical protein
MIWVEGLAALENLEKGAQGKFLVFDEGWQLFLAQGAFDGHFFHAFNLTPEWSKSKDGLSRASAYISFK